MGDAAQDFLDSGGAAENPLAANDSASDPAQTFLDSGGKTDHPLSSSKSPTLWDKYKGFQEGQLAGLTGGAASLGGGLTYLGTLAATGGDTEAAKAVKEGTERALTYQTRTDEGKSQSAAISDAAGYLGPKEGAAAGDYVMDKTGSPGLASTANAAANIPQFLLGAKAGRPYSLEDVRSGVPADPSVVSEVPAGSAGVSGAPSIAKPSAPLKALPAPAAPELTAAGAPRAPYFDINDPQAAEDLGIKPERDENPKQPGSTGNLSADQQANRKALFQRLGLSEVRKSAVEGNAQDAADDYDSTKYTGDPVGQRMSGVMAGEQQALVNHAEGIVENAGGTPGRNQSTDIVTGRTIAKPFDDLRAYIDQQKQAMYDAGNERLGSSPIDTSTLDAALNDRGLKNSLLAQGKSNFLDGVTDQLAAFKDNNGGQLNVSTAEQYRKFLNTLWGTDKHAVGTLKDALDTDVGNAVGEDVFAPARAMHQLGKQLLDNPKGVSQLFDRDPQTPVNRSTAFEDIPDKLVNMDAGQFGNVVNTLKKMPEELQRQAQDALGAIQAHMANRLLDAGNKTATQWNKKGVNNELKNNSENYSVAFADRPDLALDIKDLQDGGEALLVNTAYRGAHAQASNMIRQGIGVGAEGAGAAVGGALGTFLTGNPVGTGAGALAGKAAVSKGLNAWRNRSLRKDVEQRVVQLGDANAE